MAFTVLVTEGLDPAPAAWLAARATVLTCAHDQPAALAELLPKADGLVVRTYTKVNAPLLAMGSRLKVVGRGGVGLDNIDVPACRARGVEVVYTPDANTQAVVEYVLGLMLDAVRPRVTMPDNVTAAQFHKMRQECIGRQLDQMTLGILGFGRIGTRLGRVARAIGMRVLVNDLWPEERCRAAVEYDFEYVDKPTLYRESDVLSIHVDGRRENRGIINAAALAQLKPSCIFINAARGMLVDAAALAAWSRAHAAKGAQVILDVHEPEPPPAPGSSTAPGSNQTGPAFPCGAEGASGNAGGYPLYGLPNVRLLPHLAARTPQGMENMSWVVRDVIGVLEGQRAQFPAP
ncbi:MAG: hypothetical protein IT443_12870 [Phycisphaeraceae bacterium]|nr:hypothetical protein [Phycisphaeraceae bacterium]